MMIYSLKRCSKAVFASDESVETGSCCHYNQPGTNGTRPVDMFRILRVAYSKPIGQLLVSLPVIHPVTYQTFSPQHIRIRERGVSLRERLEKMKETFDKVTAFLQTSGRFMSACFFRSGTDRLSLHILFFLLFSSWGGSSKILRLRRLTH